MSVARAPMFGRSRVMRAVGLSAGGAAVVVVRMRGVTVQAVQRDRCRERGAEAEHAHRRAGHRDVAEHDATL
jgi:hypothetical protein